MNSAVVIIAMDTSRLIENLRKRWQAFRTANAGNVAMTFGLTLVPLMISVGAAVDYSRANSIKATMQAALDSTALAMSKTAGSINSNDLQTNATAYFTRDLQDAIEHGRAMAASRGKSKRRGKPSGDFS